MKLANLTRLPAGALVALLSLDAAAVGSLLRVACDGPDVGAEISINGVFKGECPIDVQVKEGTVLLYAVKKVNASQERVFEQQFRIGDGVVKKIELTLSAPRLNAEAQRRENERIAAERAEAARREEARQRALAEERRVDQGLLDQQRRTAGAGDAEAMLALADRYEAGNGVPKSDAEARAWVQKAAAAGNAMAALRLTDFYRTANREDLADVVKVLAFSAVAERTVGIEGEEKIRTFSASDPFFTVPGGNEKLAYWYEARYSGNNVMRSEFTCARNGMYFDIVRQSRSPHMNASGEATGALGALIWLSSTTSTGLFNSNRHDIVRIDKLSGQPFPLLPGKRFGLAYATRMSGVDTPAITTLTCGALGDRVSIPRQAGAQGLPVMCLSQTSGHAMAMRMYWHEPSGCFVMADQK